MPLLSSGARAPDSTAALDPIRIITSAIELIGFVAPTGQRVTDMLLRGQDLAFLARGAEPAPDAWISVAPADILFVIPPPLPSSAGWRPRTDGTTRTSVRVGPYRLVGIAHRPVTADTAVDQPFLPLTSVSIQRDGANEIEDVEVAIVNIGRATELRG